MGETLRFRTWHAAAFLALVSILSAGASSKEARGYWRALNRPARSPPPWVFPAVWTGLNVLQLWADLRILNNRDLPDRNALLGLRGVNWLLYALSKPAVFRSGRPGAGEAVTLAEGVTSGAAMALLARSDPLAAAALTPLTLWTAYATLLGGEARGSKPDGLVDQLRWQGAF